MIKFFRKIRQRLLGENKFSKYLFYAIGEIILVVVGILIALQINNANDSKKEKIELHQYFVKIKNDIKKDGVVLDSIKNLRLITNHNAVNAIEKLMTEEFDFITFSKAAEIFIDYYYSPNLNGYEALKNSGYLGKINGTKLDSLLVSYESQIKTLVNEEESFFGFIEEMESKWTSETNMLSLMKVYMMGPTAALEFLKTDEAKKEGFEKKLKDTFSKNSFIAAVTRTAGQTLMISYYSNIKETGQLTIQEINNLIND